MVSALLFLPLADFDGHMDWDGGWGIVMVFAMIAFWALVIGVVVWLVRELSRNGRHAGAAETDPLKTLDQRLADGSISPDDYRERRAILTGEEPPTGS